MHRITHMNTHTRMCILNWSNTVCVYIHTYTHIVDNGTIVLLIWTVVYGIYVMYSM